MSKAKHLTFNERLKIEGGLNNNKSISLISFELEKSISTISREIRNHMEVSKKCSSYVKFNDCADKFKCIRNKRIKRNYS